MNVIFFGEDKTLIKNNLLSIFILNKSKVIFSSMALSSGQRLGYAIWLVLAILLVGLHFAVAGTGHVYYNEDSYFKRIHPGTLANYKNRDFNQIAAFIIVAAGLTFIISLILLIGICADKFSPKARHIMASFNLVLEFAIAVVVAIVASQTSNWRDYTENFDTGFRAAGLTQQHDDDLGIFYRVSIADAVITFVMQVIWFVIIYFGTLDYVENQQIILTPAQQNPPITADRLQY